MHKLTVHLMIWLMVGGQLFLSCGAPVFTSFTFRLSKGVNIMSNTQKLKGKKIAILATNGFEQSELIQPRDKFIEQGAEVDVIY